jgi:hypothetical protein
MLEFLIALVVIALIALTLHAGRRPTVIYRKKVAPTDRGYSINDHPGAFGEAQHSARKFTGDSRPDGAVYGAFAFEGAELGGGGAGDFCDSASSDWDGNDTGGSDADGSDSYSDSPGDGSPGDDTSGDDTSNFSGE